VITSVHCGGGRGPVAWNGMGRLSRPGLAVFTIGAVVIVLDYVARAMFPDQWGGPNIGGGLILLAAEAVTVVGAVIIAVQFFRARSTR
jgi:hypothetical protein